jgi:hypothetical protein
VSLPKFLERALKVAFDRHLPKTDGVDWLAVLPARDHRLLYDEPAAVSSDSETQPVGEVRVSYIDHKRSDQQQSALQLTAAVLLGDERRPDRLGAGRKLYFHAARTLPRPTHAKTVPPELP